MAGVRGSQRVSMVKPSFPYGNRKKPGVSFFSSQQSQLKPASDTYIKALALMADGNKAALRLLRELCHHLKLKPDQTFQVSEPGELLRLLDEAGLYGKNIILFYKQTSHGQLSTMLGLLKAHELKMIPDDALLNSLNRQSIPLESAEILSLVQTRLSKMSQPETAESLLARLRTQSATVAKQFDA